LTLPTGAEDHRWLMDGERNLWGAALLELCVGGDVTNGKASVAGFSPVDLSVSESGVVSYGRQPGSRQVMRFEIRDRARFAQVCTQRTAELLARFPSIRP
jgi:hypothetical protein